MKLLYCQLITLKQTHCFAAFLSFFIEGNGWTNNFIKSVFPIHSLPLHIS